MRWYHMEHQHRCVVIRDTCALIRNASDTLLQVVQDHQRFHEQSRTRYAALLPSKLPLLVIIR